MDAYGVDAVDEVRLAGAFGSHIDVRHAMILGLVPDCDLDRVGSAGNAAGAGALIALLSRRARAEIEELVRGVVKIETAIEPRFPNLSRVVDLPARPAAGRAAPDDRSERRRRRQPVAAREEDR
jgi:uncharacterized 2Fe-2S/4Fe-4S cluster protein (DUF4445 family)